MNAICNRLAVYSVHVQCIKMQNKFHYGLSIISSSKDDPEGPDNKESPYSKQMKSNSLTLQTLASSKVIWISQTLESSKQHHYQYPHQIKSTMCQNSGSGSKGPIAT